MQVYTQLAVPDLHLQITASVNTRIRYRQIDNSGSLMWELRTSNSPETFDKKFPETPIKDTFLAHNSKIHYYNRENTNNRIDVNQEITVQIKSL